MSAESDLIKLFKALGDPSRLQIIKALMEKPLYVEILSERLNLSASTISFHLKKLQEIGLVEATREQYYTVYTLKNSVFTSSIQELIQQEDSQESDQKIREQKYREKVLATFLINEKVPKLPVQRKKRRIILEYIAEKFEHDQGYPEREFSLDLSEIHEDFCTLRREMICEKLFYRENGIYYRSKENHDF